MRCWSCQAQKASLLVRDETYSRELAFCSEECRDIQLTKKGLFRVRPLAVLRRQPGVKPHLKSAVALIPNSQGQYLMLGRKDQWFFPGGKLEGLETAEEGVTREVREETGIVGVNPKVLHSCLHSHFNGQDYDIAVISLIPLGEIVRLSTEHDAFGWYTPQEALGSLALAGPITKMVLEILAEG